MKTKRSEAKACEGVGCPINIYDYKIYIHIFRRHGLVDPCPLVVPSGTCLVSVYYDYDTNLRLGTIKREDAKQLALQFGQSNRLNFFRIYLD